MSAIAQYRLLIGKCPDFSLSKEYDAAPDGSLIKRTSGDRNYFWWHFWPVDCADEAAVIELAGRIQPKPHLCLINGILSPDVSPGQKSQKLAARWRGADNTIVDGYVMHLLLDFDSVVVPPGMGRADQFRAAVTDVDGRLPPSIAGKRKIVLRSASSGMKDDTVNFHMIVPMADAATFAEIETWQRGAAAAGFPVDPQQAVLGQICYTAEPIVYGGTDPISPADRAFILHPDAPIASFDIHEFDGEAHQVDEHQRRVLNEALSKGWRHAADELVGIGLEGKANGSRFFGPLSAVLGVAARSGEDIDAIAEYLLPLIEKRVRALDPKDHARRIAYYGRGFLEKHLGSFQRRDSAASARIESGLTAIFGQRPNKDGQ